METFSKQLERLYKRQMASYGRPAPVANPLKRKISVAWISTPVVACIGLIIGLGIRPTAGMNAQGEQAKVAASIQLPEYRCSASRYTTIHLAEICIIPKK